MTVFEEKLELKKLKRKLLLLKTDQKKKKPKSQVLFALMLRGGLTHLKDPPFAQVHPWSLLHLRPYYCYPAAAA